MSRKYCQGLLRALSKLLRQECRAAPVKPEQKKGPGTRPGLRGVWEETPKKGRDATASMSLLISHLQNFQRVLHWAIGL
jgi:hypothetical protein